MAAVRIIILMGVSGCGKSVLGETLGTKLGLKFIEGDEFHTSVNRKKMGSGIPLNDQDGLSWLTKLGDLATVSYTHLTLPTKA